MSNLIVFDVDGTLIGGESVDWVSFDAALEEVLGLPLSEGFFAGIEEVTAQAIVHVALGGRSLEEKKRLERRVCEGFVRRLKEAHAADPSCFPVLEGVAALMRELRDEGVPIAIATGDWRESICFKLEAAGIDVTGIPMATASEYYTRAEIIAASVALAGRSLDEAVYVGDGLWDLRACQKLGIPFIGVGHRREEFLKAEAPHVLHDLSPTAFRRAHEAIKTSRAAARGIRV